MSEKLKYAKLIIKFYIKWNENELNEKSKNYILLLSA